MLYSASLILLLLSFGQLGKSDYIVGGVKVSIKDRPFQVALQLNDRFMCGGSLLSLDLVLTAGHCVFGHQAEKFTIRVGSDNPDKGGKVIAAEDIYLHPKYDYTIADYDIAIIKLKEKVKLSDKIKLTKIAARDHQIPNGAIATVTGWGYLKEDALVPSSILQGVQVPKISNKDCKAEYPTENVTERMICFGYQAGGKDACQGDSGGPLTWEDIQVGVVSWGIGCAQPNRAGIYTNIPDIEINDFITKYLNDKK